MGEATPGAGGGPAPLAENVILCNFGFEPLTNILYNLKSA